MKVLTEGETKKSFLIEKIDSILLRYQGTLFSVGSYEINGKIIPATSVTPCREHVIYYFCKKHNGSKIPVCGTELRVFIVQSYNEFVVSDKKFYQLISEDDLRMGTVEKILNTVEKDAGFSEKSCVQRLCSPDMFKKRNIVYFIKGPWEWLCMPQMLSLFMLFVKTIAVKEFDNIYTWNMFRKLSDLKDITPFVNAGPLTEKSRREGEMWEIFLKNYSYLIGKRTTREMFLLNDCDVGIKSLTHHGISDKITIQRWNNVLQTTDSGQIGQNLL